MTIADHALALARAGWEVFPLAGKVPLIKGGRGVLDATTDEAVVHRWWKEHPAANIGGRVPAGVIVLDVDPRSGGAESMTELVRAHGLLPTTLTVISGRGDGGRHYYMQNRLTKVSGAQLGPGLDLKTPAGYCVMPPSLHPETGHPYRMQGTVRRPARMPEWLEALLAPPAPLPRPAARHLSLAGGPGIADRYSAEATWPDVLGPHGWRCVHGDGDSDGSRWLHPTATSAVSATVRNGCLFVYSPNTPLPITEAGSPSGVTKFRAYALLTHHGDMSAAARALLGRAVTAA